MKSFELINIGEIHKLEISGENLELKEREIRGIILNIYSEWRKDNLPSKYYPCRELLSQSWCWKDGTKRTLPQRINRIFKEKGYYLGKGYLGKMGNAIREAIPVQEEYYIDITQNFNWNEGDFGDGDSCFWDGRKEIRNEMSKDGRFYAFRFYNKESVGSHFTTFFKDNAGGIYSGVARTWLLKENAYIRYKNKILSRPILILFNSYGKGLKQQASILAILMDGISKSITLSNQKRQSGGLYINNGGYVIGSPNTIETISHFDLGLKNTFDGEIARIDEDEPYPGMTARIVMDSHYIQESLLIKKRRAKLKWSDQRKKKKRKHKQGINNILARAIHYHNKDTLFYLLRSIKIVGAKRSTILHWKTYVRLLHGNFFSILLKILSYKIINGGYNGRSKKKSQSS